VPQPYLRGGILKMVRKYDTPLESVSMPQEIPEAKTHSFALHINNWRVLHFDRAANVKSFAYLPADLTELP